MPARAIKPDHRQYFILGQPFWLADEEDVVRRWQMAMSEQDPSGDEGERALAFRPPPESDSGREAEAHWRRIHRRELVTLATSGNDQQRRVGLVCGAGLGKTTNLQWLESAINRETSLRGKNLAFFLELRDLPSVADKLLDLMTERIANRSGQAEDRVRWAVRRLRAAGRVTLLLDSLDQAGPDPKGPVVRALLELLGSPWQDCRIWLSSRPYALRIAKGKLHDDHPNTPWQFVRVGQLDEPECRFLLETAKKPAAE